MTSSTVTSSEVIFVVVGFVRLEGITERINFHNSFGLCYNLAIFLYNRAALKDF